MMNQMRENTKIIMIVVSVAFVGLMVFGWGMDITGRGTGTNQLGKVNGDAVTFEEYNATYRNLYDQQQKQSQGPISASVNKQIEDAAWNQVVLQHLISQELERRGIQVTDAEIRQAARFAPPPEFADNQLFQTNGQFDINKYHQFLSSNAVDNQLLLQLEAYYRDIIPRSKLYYQVTSGAFITDSELWRMWRDETEKVSVRYIALDADRLVPNTAVTVTDKDIANYYDTHKESFARPARAHARVLVLERTPNAADTAAARAKVDSLRQVLVNGGNFAQIARAESSDEASARNGGDLGTIRKGQTVPAFEQAAFSLPLNQVSQPVLTQFGYHLIEALKRTDSTVDARHILIPIRITQEHDDALLEKADSLEKLVTTQPLPNVALALALNMRTVDLEPDATFVPGVGQMDDGIQWAFEEAKPKDVSTVFETPTMYYVVEVLEKTPEGQVPLKDATPAIRAKLLAEKKLTQAKTIGREMVDQIRKGQTLEQVAQARGLAVQTAGPFARVDFVPGLGRANAAIGTAFGLQDGQTSGVVETKEGLFIIQAVSHVPADRKQFDQQSRFLRTRIESQLAEQRWQQFLTALREQAKIVDRRKEVLRKPTDDELPQVDPVTGAPLLPAR